VREKLKFRENYFFTLNAFYILILNLVLFIIRRGLYFWSFVSDETVRSEAGDHFFNTQVFEHMLIKFKIFKPSQQCWAAFMHARRAASIGSLPCRPAPLRCCQCRPHLYLEPPTALSLARAPLLPPPVQELEQSRLATAPPIDLLPPAALLRFLMPRRSPPPPPTFPNPNRTPPRPNRRESKL